MLVAVHLSFHLLELLSVVHSRKPIDISTLPLNKQDYNKFPRMNYFSREDKLHGHFIFIADVNGSLNADFYSNHKVLALEMTSDDAFMGYTLFAMTCQLC